MISSNKNEYSRITNRFFLFNVYRHHIFLLIWKICIKGLQTYSQMKILMSYFLLLNFEDELFAEVLFDLVALFVALLALLIASLTFACDACEALLFLLKLEPKFALDDCLEDAFLAVAADMIEIVNKINKNTRIIFFILFTLEI